MVPNSRKDRSGETRKETPAVPVFHVLLENFRPELAAATRELARDLGNEILVYSRNTTQDNQQPPSPTADNSESHRKEFDAILSNASASISPQQAISDSGDSASGHVVSLDTPLLRDLHRISATSHDNSFNALLRRAAALLVGHIELAAQETPRVDWPRQNRYLQYNAEAFGLVVLDDGDQLIYANDIARSIGTHRLIRVCERALEKGDEHALDITAERAVSGCVIMPAMRASLVSWKQRPVLFLKLAAPASIPAAPDVQPGARLDRLTGLATRTVFWQSAEQRLREVSNDDDGVALLLIDIDRMKQINEALGNSVGDQVLITLANRLRAGLRNDDIICRIGPDEFGILLHNIRGSGDLIQVVEKLHKLASATLSVGKENLRPTVSVGVAEYPRDGSGFTELMQHVDMALSRARELGGSRCEFYDPNMSLQIRQRWLLEERLRSALDRQQFEIDYQPIVHPMSGAITGAEALLRWNPPGEQRIYPDEFIPILEETGMIIPVGEWVLFTACDQLRQWQERGYPGLTMNVNLSPRQFNDPSLVEKIKCALNHSKLPARYLGLEITENLLMHSDGEVQKTMQALRELGVRLYIDDFGTGYSSLSYLKRLPVAGLKIDRSFVQDLPDDKNDAAIALTILDLCRHMQLEVVAEGVETPQQADFLARHGADLLQGYFFARPCGADDFERKLRRDYAPNAGAG